MLWDDSPRPIPQTIELRRVVARAAAEVVERIKAVGARFEKRATSDADGRPASL